MKNFITNLIAKTLFLILTFVFIGIFLLFLGLVVYGCMVVWSYVF